MPMNLNCTDVNAKPATSPMKINYKNTALSVLEGDSDNIGLPEPHKPMTEHEKQQFGNSVLSALKSNADLFNRKVQYVSESFFDAYEKGRHKLINIFYKEEIEESGTFVWSGGSFTHTTFYFLKTYTQDGIWKVDYMFLQFSKHSKNDFKNIDVCIAETDESFREFIYKGHYENGLDRTHYLSFLVTFICFIKHVELQTKIIPAKRKDTHIGVKYVNETNNNIEVLDSTWFTNIVRSEGFAVRGHFRFQAMGKNHSERKLIWIADFEKEGYERKAKKLMHAENSIETI